MWLLTKCSSPSWEKSFTDIKELHKTLEGQICDGCKINTFEEMKASFQSSQVRGDFTDEDVRDELDFCSISENYDELSLEEQVDDLMGTACGCEYLLEENN